MITNNFYGSSSVSSYLSSLLGKPDKSASDGAASTGGATSGANAMQAASKAAMQTAAQSFKSSNAQHALDKRQDALASELKAGLSKAGVTLEGAVEFSVDAKGELAIGGSEKDRAAVKAFLKGDTSSPGLSARMGELVADADALSGSIRQSAAISQAARYAGSPSSVMALYATIASQQEATAAVFSISGTGNGLSYPGVLNSEA